MAWTYQQSTGNFFQEQTFIVTGYSGQGEGRDNPSAESIPNMGPIPEGYYSIGSGFAHPQCGPMSMHLTPLEGTNTYGRDSFLIHGDNASLDHTASHGCIILPRQVRDLVSASSDRELIVVP